VVLALPEIQRSLQVGLASVIWVIIGYLLVITLLSTQVDCGGRGHEPRHRVSRVGLGGVVVRSGRRV